MSKKFYITTAIDYPNGKPHIGHAFEKVISDTYARFYRLQGFKTHFLTGTDENGQKLILSAQKNNLPTQEFVDNNVKYFKELCKNLNISHDDFIRTTEQRHKKVCKELWSLLETNHQIYKGSYSGNYCYSCESFYSANQVENNTCPHHSTELVPKNEDGFFFKLSEYHDFILNHIKNNPQFIKPEKYQKEILSRLENEKLQDISFSRINEGWGIEVPSDNKFVMYTWADALVNYYSAAPDGQWPADLHVIGKDILWFHAVIWPCMLKALSLPLPKQIYVHGMILGPDGKKMGKSNNNVIDPEELIQNYNIDSIRYYLLRAISSKADGAFVEEDLKERHDSELANSLGNLVIRIIKLYKKKCDSNAQIAYCDTFKLKDHLNQTISYFEKREHDLAIAHLFSLINTVNQYLTQNEPWKIEDVSKFKESLHPCLYALDYITKLLSCFLPETANKIQSFLNTKESELLPSTIQINLSEPEHLFQKFVHKTQKGHK